MTPWGRLTNEELAMQVGMTTIFQGVDGISDAEVWRNEVALAELAEPLGFDSVWGVEHHFTAYTMCPDVLQFLTYMAGRTKRVQLGSMAVILPWHDPVRVAEQVALLDRCQVVASSSGWVAVSVASSSRASASPWTSRGRASSKRPR